MTDSSPAPFTQHHVQSLVRYADEFDSSSFARLGFTFADAHTDDVRALAGRISRYTTKGVGQFTDDDSKLLSQIGESLVKHATQTLAQRILAPGERHHAQLMLGVGNEILAARDVVRAHVLV